MDVLFINPNSSKKVYQDLSTNYAAIETPTWALLLAQSCRSRGYEVGILDADAERLTDSQAIVRIKSHDPRLVCFVVYGQNPNSGTTNMEGAARLSQRIKETDSSRVISVVGSHVQSLPLEVLEKENSFDLIFLNEGVYSLWNILQLDSLHDKDELEKVNGIGFVKDGAP